MKRKTRSKSLAPKTKIEKLTSEDAKVGRLSHTVDTRIHSRLVVYYIVVVFFFYIRATVLQYCIIIIIIF